VRRKKALKWTRLRQPFLVRSFYLVGQVVENQTKVVLHQRLDGVGGRDPDTLCNATHTHLVDVGQDRAAQHFIYIRSKVHEVPAAFFFIISAAFAY